MSGSSTIVWFRLDLRLDDNPALLEALDIGGPIVPLFIWPPEEEKPWPPGETSRWWLHQSLKSLRASLKQTGSGLIVRQGNALDELLSIVTETNAKRVYWNRRYEPAATERDKTVKAALKDRGIEARSFNSALLYEPWEIQTKSGGLYKVFTPYWNACQKLPPPPAPIAAPKNIPSLKKPPRTLSIDGLELEPKIDWTDGIRKTWTPGECGAQEQLQRFIHEAVDVYSEERDHPALCGTSRLSPYLHFGEISPRRVWHAVLKRQANLPVEKSQSAWAYLRELGWREFAHHILYHFPHTADKPMNPEFSRFPWKNNKKALQCWKKGMTGYPIVDAGMRELWATGWMHNRVRMMVASFLVKDLLVPWREGAKWFWDTLVDADLANNSMGWQWTAGCGADAAPYFRIFNPVLQGEKFDPQGEYVRRWVPELKDIPNKYLHKPWEAPEGVLQQAGIVLGKEYPKPIVDHFEAKEAAMAAYRTIKKA